MKTSQIIKDNASLAILAAATVFISLFATLLITLLPINIEPIFRPRNSGLNDWVNYFTNMGIILGLLAYIALLVYFFKKQKLRATIPWIVAAIFEIALLAVSILDHSRGHYPYTLSEHATGWMQIFVVLPLAAGVLCFRFNHSAVEGKSTEVIKKKVS
jgi:hypothetical protein